MPGFLVWPPSFGRLAWGCSTPRWFLLARPPERRRPGIGRIGDRSSFRERKRLGASDCAHPLIWGRVLPRSGDDLLSHVLRRSTIGATGLNGRVRDGIGCLPRAVITRPRKEARIPCSCLGRACPERFVCSKSWIGVSFDKLAVRSPRPHAMGLGSDRPTSGSYQAYRAISTGRLSASQRLHLRPIDVVVFHGSQGDLVLRGASRLDAFSGYPVRT